MNPYPCAPCRVGDHDLCIGAECGCLTPLHDIMVPDDLSDYAEPA